MQWEKGKQEITHSAYLKVKEGYTDERREKKEGRGTGLVFWSGWSVHGR